MDPERPSPTARVAVVVVCLQCPLHFTAHLTAPSMRATDLGGSAGKAVEDASRGIDRLEACHGIGQPRSSDAAHVISARASRT